jgi:hypothetical protein
MTIYPALDSALSRSGAQMDRLRQSLYYCDVNFSQKATRQLRMDVHATSYVLGAAAVEAYIGAMLGAVVDEVNSQNLSICDLRLSLFAIVHGPHLDSLQDIRGLKMWNRRVGIFEGMGSTGTCQIDPTHLPLDGRTIRPVHLDTIWDVMGFQATMRPGPLHRLALTNLADNRNLVAHGSEDTAAVAGRQSVSDTLRSMERIEELLLQLHYAATDYLDRRAYLR